MSDWTLLRVPTDLARDVAAVAAGADSVDIHERLKPYVPDEEPEILAPEHERPMDCTCGRSEEADVMHRNDGRPCVSLFRVDV